MSDDRYWYNSIVRELTYVRYVPALRKNLISIGMLEAKGIQIVMENGEFKVLKRSIVVMKSARHMKLYYLNGNMTASVEDDTTRL